jgi:small-conductance mechanosensitive channel
MMARLLEDASAWRILAVGVVVAAAALLLGLLVSWLLRRLVRQLGVDVQAGSHGRSPVVLIVVLAVLQVYNRLLDRAWADEVASLLGVGLTAAVAWLFVVLALMLEKGALARFPETDLEDLKSRHARTQIGLLRRIAVAVIITVAIGAILWSFPIVHELGVSVLASASVLGIIVGVAAQTTLGNVFAGMQVAFTDAIRVGDVVVINKQRGRVETITLTYVVVRVSDGTSLILPCTYFTTTPFQNWTHAESQVVGQVDVDVVADWAVPVQDIRDELRRIVRESAHWDGGRVELVVHETTDTHLVLRAFAGANSIDTTATLQWEIREGLVAFLQRNPSAIPRTRQQDVDGDQPVGGSVRRDAGERLRGGVTTEGGDVD